MHIQSRSHKHTEQTDGRREHTHSTYTQLDGGSTHTHSTRKYMCIRVDFYVHTLHYIAHACMRVDCCLACRAFAMLPRRVALAVAAAPRAHCGAGCARNALRRAVYARGLASEGPAPQAPLSAYQK